MPSIRTQSRQGSNHSKSVEPKVSASPKGNQLHERNKNKDPFQIIAEKYSNINKKKQSTSSSNPGIRLSCFKITYKYQEIYLQKL